MSELKYDYLRYNRHGSLRPSLVILAILIFLSRHSIAFLLVAMARGKGGGLRGTPELAQLVEPIYILTNLAPIMLLITMGDRSPKAGAFSRRLWRLGRETISATIVFYYALFVYQSGLDIAAYGWYSWTVLALDLGILAYVWQSEYVRDLFASFAEPEGEGETAG